MKIPKWTNNLNRDTLKFIDSLKGESVPGFFHYTKSGDIYPEKIHWGLGNTVFAVKALYILGKTDLYNKAEIINFINTFKLKNGYIRDPLIMRKSRTSRILSSIKAKNFNNIFNRLNMIAETKQAYESLKLLENVNGYFISDIPKSESQIITYIHSLNWKRPWGAASNINKLVFFLNVYRECTNLDLNTYTGLLEVIFSEVNKYRRNNGFWYAGDTCPPKPEIINAAMKMLMAYHYAEKSDVKHMEKLIDVCLSTGSIGNACNRLNIVFILHFCRKRTGYQKDAVEQFMADELQRYERHYWPDYGGFSFYEGRASGSYYGAPITRGLPEPDIHGTELLLWGISLIGDVLDINGEIGLSMLP